MFSRTASRVAIASASAVIAGGALAVPAHAAPPSPAPIAPHQLYVGQVFGAVSSTSTQNVIEVVCPGPLTTGGHPVAGQYVEVQQVGITPVASTGYTGNFGTGIEAELVYTAGSVTAVTPVAKLASYGVKVEIPTSITAPCSGSAVMSFVPLPDPDSSGRPSNVPVTFQNVGA
jgi:hypothetical protein